jgi:trehalose 6-phosphate phosphatase
VTPTPLFPITDALEERLGGTPLVVMLDVDGTLAPIAPRPDEVVVPEETRRAVAALAARDDVHVVLVSGRAALDARRLVSALHVWVIGNHGFEITGPDGEELVDQQVAHYRPAVAQAVRRLASRVAPVPGVVLEDKGWTLSLHYRLADPAVVPKLRAAVEETAAQLGLRLTHGKQVFEVRPPVRLDKGTAVLLLGRKLGGLEESGSLLFIGDDLTDEDAFRALRARSAEPVTVRVTHDETVATAAEYAACDPMEVRAFLEWLVTWRA